MSKPKSKSASREKKNKKRLILNNSIRNIPPHNSLSELHGLRRLMQSQLSMSPSAPLLPSALLPTLVLLPKPKPARHFSGTTATGTIPASAVALSPVCPSSFTNRF
jgi:hypothetical protein